MNHGSRSANGLALAGVAILAVFVSASLLGCGGASASVADVAVLGGEGLQSRVWQVDTGDARVTAVSRLRSLALACGVDRQRRVITAQCGGLGEQVDDVLGVVDPAGRVRYVQLPAPNPTDVVVCGDVAVVLHGFDAGNGMWMTSVDLRSGSVLATAAAEGRPQRLGRAGGGVIMTTADDKSPTSVQVGALDPRTLAFKSLANLNLSYAVPAANTGAGDSGHEVVVVGFSDGGTAAERASGSRIVRLDTRSGRVLESTPAAGLSNGAFDAVWDGRTLAVVDATAAEPSQSDGVALFAGTPFSPVGRISRVSARAVSLNGGSVLVADGATGRLGVYSRTGSPIRCVDLGPFGDAVRIVGLPAKASDESATISASL